RQTKDDRSQQSEENEANWERDFPSIPSGNSRFGRRCRDALEARGWRRRRFGRSSQLLQVMTDLRGALIAQLPVLLQRLRNDLVESCRHSGIQAFCGLWRFMQYGGKGRADGLTLERQTPRGHLVNHDSKREQVGARIQFLAVNLLWRHEGDSARGASRCG